MYIQRHLYNSLQKWGLQYFYELSGWRCNSIYTRLATTIAEVKKTKTKKLSVSKKKEKTLCPVKYSQSHVHMYKGSIAQAWPIGGHPAGRAVTSLQVPQVMLESMICHYSAKHSIACSVRKTHAPTNWRTPLSVSLTNETPNSWAWPSTTAKRL